MFLLKNVTKCPFFPYKVNENRGSERQRFGFFAPDSTFLSRRFFRGTPLFFRWQVFGLLTGLYAAQPSACQRSYQWQRGKEKNISVKRSGEERCYWMSTALFPVSSSHLAMITSTYLGSSSITYASRSFCSQAMIVVPLPPNRSRTAPFFSVLF